MVLTRNFTVLHGILNNPLIYDSYIVNFVEQRIYDSLDTCEDKWLNNLNIRSNV